MDSSLGTDRMTRYKLHCNGASGNSYKIALYLNCARLDWEPVGVDFGVTREANWRVDNNAMGEVPVLALGSRGGSRCGSCTHSLRFGGRGGAPTSADLLREPRHGHARRHADEDA
jgi:hypothetical protein